jgi:heme oxygenase (mycobilin-producing)
MLVVSHFTVPETDGPAFTTSGRQALAALAARPGFRRGRLGRAADDPTAWVLVTEWDGVGAYRRALSNVEVRLHATPLLGLARQQPSAFEILLAWEANGVAVTAESGRAAGQESQLSEPSERIEPA